jgi:hypothetical protein
MKQLIAYILAVLITAVLGASLFGGTSVSASAEQGNVTAYYG